MAQYLTLLKGKLHNAEVIEANVDYDGSVEIDTELMQAAGFIDHERVEIYNITNGNRFATYVIPGKKGSKMIGVQGAAAHQVEVGDRVIICAYTSMKAKKAEKHEPRVVRLTSKNEVIR